MSTKRQTNSYPFPHCYHMPNSPVSLQVGEDPFSQLKQEKRERVKAQHQRQVANIKSSSKGGGDAVALPPTLKLAAALPAHGRGKLNKRQEMQDDVRAPMPCLL